MDTGNTLYYMKVDRSLKGHSANDILSFIKSGLDKQSFETLQEALYFKINEKEGNGFGIDTLRMYMGNNYTPVSHQLVKSNESFEEIYDSMVLIFTNFFGNYINKNKDKLKLVLFDKSPGESKEEKLLKDSVKEVKLEEIVS